MIEINFFGAEQPFHEGLDVSSKRTTAEIALRKAMVVLLLLILESVLSGAGENSAFAQDRSHFDQRDGIDSPSKPPDGAIGNFELVPLFDNGAPALPSVMFEMPDDARYGSSKAVTRGNGINLMAAYHQSDGTIRGHGAKAIGQCNGGDCKALLLTIENIVQVNLKRTNADRIHAGSMQDIEATRASPNVHTTEIDPLGFTLGFAIRRSSRASDFATVDHVYFRKAAASDHYDLAARCSMWTPVHGCRLYFSLPCAPQVAVSTSLYPLFEDLADVEKVRAASVSYVASLVTSEKSCRN